MKNLKRTLALLCIGAVCLAGCGQAEKESSPAGGEDAVVSEDTADQGNVEEQTSEGQTAGTARTVAVSARPVEIAAGRMILLDEANQKYGLYDSEGKEILPCAYGDMQFVTVNQYEPKTYVALQDKGSYALYDLDGNEVAAPAYDKITGGASYADCVIVEKSDAFGAVDLQGNEIVPVQYADISCSPQGVLGAVMNDGGLCTVDLYAADGTVQSSFQTELVKTGTAMGSSGGTSLSFYNWGNIVSIETDTAAQRCTLDGTVFTGMISLLSVEDPYFEYLEGNTLSFINGETGETVVSTELGLQEGEVPLLQGKLKIDAASGNVIGVMDVTPCKDNLPVSDTKSYLVSLGDSASISPVSDYKEIGPFYEGSAFAVADDKLYVLDSSGNATELSAPFNAPSDAYLLYEGCAVLNNNDYIYVVDKAGNTILSEDGYAEVDWTYYRGEGLIVLTASDGSTQLIDTYGKEVIPQGNGWQQIALYDAEGEDAEVYSLIYDPAAGNYIFTDNENLRAFDSHGTLDEDFAARLTAGNGWVLWDETTETLFAVVSDESGYQVCDAAGMAE